MSMKSKKKRKGRLNVKCRVQYKNCCINYKASALKKFFPKYCANAKFGDNYDLQFIAMMHFCATHFMDGIDADLSTFDAETRGRTWQIRKYCPNDVFKGWLETHILPE